MREGQRTDWFRDAKWGVFAHYLGAVAGSKDAEMTADEWNRRIDEFDVRKLAGQLSEAGAGYAFITLGQNSGHYCAPNAVYDEIVGIVPSKCSRRDLIADLSEALAEYRIPLMVYVPSGAPAADAIAVSKLEWEWGYEGHWPASAGGRTGKRLAAFQLKWESVLREWSLRWGKKVSGWWIDGVYFADEMYRHPDAPNFASLAGALREGNPDSLIAYATGVHRGNEAVDPTEDYISGELDFTLAADLSGMDWNTFEPKRIQRFLNGKQYHVLTFLGEWWGKGQPRFPVNLVKAYTEYVNSHEGVVSWDVPLTREGHIPPEFMDQLCRLGQSIR